MVGLAASIIMEDARPRVGVFITPAPIAVDCHVGPRVALGQRRGVSSVHRLEYITPIVQRNTVSALHVHIADHLLVVDFLHFHIVPVVIVEAS